MFKRRRFARRCALVLATAAVAVPGVAQAKPLDPRLEPVSPPESVEPAAPIVREIESGGEGTVALVLSGTALLVAAAGAGYTRRRVGGIAQS
jgi:hypothetical protein